MPDTTKTSKGVIEFDLKHAVEKKKMSREEIEREIDKAEAKGYEVRIPRSQMGFLELYDEMSGRKRSGEWTTGKEMTNRALKAAPLAASFVPGVRAAALAAGATDLVTGQIRNKMKMGGPRGAGEALTSAATRGLVAGGAVGAGNLLGLGVNKLGQHTFDRALSLTQTLQARFPNLNIGEIVREMRAPFTREGGRAVGNQRVDVMNQKNRMIDAADAARGPDISLGDLWRAYTGELRRHDPNLRFDPVTQNNPGFAPFRDEIHEGLSALTDYTQRPRPTRIGRGRTERLRRQFSALGQPRYNAAIAGRNPVLGGNPEHGATMARALGDLLHGADQLPGLAPLDARLQALKAAQYAVLRASRAQRAGIGPWGIIQVSPERARGVSQFLSAPATRNVVNAIPRTLGAAGSYILAPSNEYWEKHPEEDE